MSIKRPANLDDAVKKLGLQHALGSLRLVKFDSLTSPVTNENVGVANMLSQAQHTDSAQQSAASPVEKTDADSLWVPLHLQLGLPLAPAELCDLVCK